MGNKIGRRRQVVDEKYTRPQGLYQHREVDHKKLRKLILDSKLAPCYPGDEDPVLDLEECPICFLYYPSLNRSRCCMKGICTECFLQMKPPNSTRPTHCPFCKTSNYAVEYRGVRTKEEKGMEQIEEQKVIEAQIRMRQQELQEEEERMQRRYDASSSSRVVSPAEPGFEEILNNKLSVPSFRSLTQGDDIVPSEASCSVPSSRRPFHLRQNREDNFDLDLEEVMVMEAIWLSIQEQGAPRNPDCGGSSLQGQSSADDCYDCQASAPGEASSSAGLACAVAVLAEHQHMNGDAANIPSTSAPVYSMLQHSGSIPAGREVVGRNYPPESWVEVSPGSGTAVPREGHEWMTNYGSELAEAGTSYESSDIAMDTGPVPFPLPDGVIMTGGHILPENYEEQMMLAMAISVAEARSRMSTPSLTWM